MAYSRFVPGFSRHLKRIKSGPVASWLWACSVDHCTEYLTDSFLDEQAVPGLCPVLTGPALKKCVDLLVSVGSWERVEGGYIVHNYLKHNLSKLQVEADNQASRQRYRRFTEKHRDNAVATPETTPLQTPLATPLEGGPTPLATPYQTPSQTERKVGRLVGLETPKNFERPVAHATGSNGITAEQLADHEAKKAAVRKILKHAFPNQEPPA